MTCGDLGTNALLVDRSLTDLFRLAHLWDCVLLLDEADIFLAKRGNHDLDRNALVSGKLFQLVRKRHMC
ncbi:AAA family [Colletotrichum chrysophilum]|uniref:AAA family n=1 Tax=Colletotrichum chrysophilum TaxID=1836956 RepID=A0AAD9B316_9PEZI|nr:AAA family [Colletotrichum chrysophilum]